MADKIIHHRIAKTAKAQAREAWELMAREDAFYRLWKDPKVYVRRNWQHYIPYARQALVGILTKDFSHQIAMGSYSQAGVDAMKNEVYECLLIDGGFKTPAQGQAALH